MKKLTLKERREMAAAAQRQRVFITQQDYRAYPNGEAVRAADYEYLRLLERAANTGERIWPTVTPDPVRSPSRHN